MLVVLQYTAKIHTGKLTRFIRSLDPSRKGGQYQLAPAKVRAVKVAGGAGGRWWECAVMATCCEDVGREGIC